MSTHKCVWWDCSMKLLGGEHCGTNSWWHPVKSWASFPADWNAILSGLVLTCWHFFFFFAPCCGHIIFLTTAIWARNPKGRWRLPNLTITGWKKKQVYSLLLIVCQRTNCFHDSHVVGFIQHSKNRKKSNSSRVTGQLGGFLCVNIQSSLRLAPPVALVHFHPPPPRHVDGVSVFPNCSWNLVSRGRSALDRGRRDWGRATKHAVRPLCGCVRTFLSLVHRSYPQFSLSFLF